MQLKGANQTTQGDTGSPKIRETGVELFETYFLRAIDELALIAVADTSPRKTRG
jgi:hypothetical protein